MFKIGVSNVAEWFVFKLSNNHFNNVNNKCNIIFFNWGSCVCLCDSLYELKSLITFDGMKGS
jgi:hypothetical protein